jgi:hypothetical protein
LKRPKLSAKLLKVSMIQRLSLSESIASIANIGRAVAPAAMASGIASVMATGMTMAITITGAAATF